MVGWRGDGVGMGRGAYCAMGRRFVFRLVFRAAGSVGREATSGGGARGAGSGTVGSLTGGIAGGGSGTSVSSGIGSITGSSSTVSAASSITLPSFMSDAPSIVPSLTPEGTSGGTPSLTPEDTPATPGVVKKSSAVISSMRSSFVCREDNTCSALANACSVTEVASSG